MKLTYDEVSPITGNKSVLVEFDELTEWTKICMDSGYTTNYSWIDGSPQVEAFEFACPEHIKDSKYVAANGQVWYKLTLSQGDVMLYPDVYDGDPMWIVGYWRDLYLDETIDTLRHMIRYEKSVDGIDIPRVFDVEGGQFFEEQDFESAYNYFQKLSNEQYNS